MRSDRAPLRLSLALPHPCAQYNRQERDAKAVQAKVEAATAARVAAEQVGHGLHQMQLLDCIAIERDAISEMHRASRTARPVPLHDRAELIRPAESVSNSGCGIRNRWRCIQPIQSVGRVQPSSCKNRPRSFTVTRN